MMIRNLIISDIPPDIELLIDIFIALGDDAAKYPYLLDDLLSDGSNITLTYAYDPDDDYDTGYVANPQYTERYWVWDEEDINRKQLKEISYFEVLRLYNPDAYRQHQPTIPLQRIY